MFFYLCASVWVLFPHFFSIFILSFSSHTHSRTLNFQHPKWHIFSLSNELLYVLGLVLLSLSACDDLLRSISEIMVQMLKKTWKKQIELQRSREKKRKTPTIQNEDEKVEKGVCVHNKNFCEHVCVWHTVCKLMHEIIWYWSMRYMKSIRKFNLLIYTNIVFPFPILRKKSGKQRMRIRDACIIYSLLATHSNWTFRKKLISFSIIKFGYWKKCERAQWNKIRDSLFV